MEYSEIKIHYRPDLRAGAGKKLWDWKMKTIRARVKSNPIRLLASLSVLVFLSILVSSVIFPIVILTVVFLFLMHKRELIGRYKKEALYLYATGGEGYSILFNDIGFMNSDRDLNRKNWGTFYQVDEVHEEGILYLHRKKPSTVHLFLREEMGEESFVAFVSMAKQKIKTRKLSQREILSLIFDRLNSKS